MAKLGKNENVTTDVLVKICTALQCDIGDIMEVIEKNNRILSQKYEHEISQNYMHITAWILTLVPSDARDELMKGLKNGNKWFWKT